MGKGWAPGAQRSADDGGGRGRVWTHSGLSEAPCGRAVFKSGSGRGKSRREERRGLAGKPQRKGKGPGTDAATDNTDGKLRQGPLQHPLQQSHPHSSGALVSTRPVSAKHKGISQAKNQSQSTSAVPQQHGDVGLGQRGDQPSSASGSSDSWGGKGSHSPGNGSPHWCLLGPRGWGGEKVVTVKTVPSPCCTSPLRAFARAGPPAANGPLGLSYPMEAVSKTFLGSHGTPSYMVSVNAPLAQSRQRRVMDCRMSCVGVHPGSGERAAPLPASVPGSTRTERRAPVSRNASLVKSCSAPRSPTGTRGAPPLHVLSGL